MTSQDEIRKAFVAVCLELYDTEVPSLYDMFLAGIEYQKGRRLSLSEMADAMMGAISSRNPAEWDANDPSSYKWARGIAEHAVELIRKAEASIS